MPTGSEKYPHFENHLMEIKGILARVWLDCPSYTPQQIEEAAIYFGAYLSPFRSLKWIEGPETGLAKLGKILIALEIQVDEWLMMVCSDGAFERAEKLKLAIPAFVDLDADSARVQ